jgi:fluoride exporter
MTTLVAVASGGALGAVSRYVLGGWIQGMSDGSFPWGTWTVNVLGSLLLGFAMVWLTEALASSELRLFVAMGFLGSFTTFSTFSFETVELIREGLWMRAGIYSMSSLAIGVLAVAVGAVAAVAASR